ncbi:MAG: phosphatase PAP2 family protein [Ardenticatenaceae bacterium]|nr:phosphatase PAP2 family protein [Ardenticatenaceae bacterium]MCB9445025.1 phosphatase PAP2 family protein [Ardenticatenaceae bacterium]
MDISFLPDSRRTWITWLLALGILLTAVTLFLELAEDVWLNEGFTWDPALMLAIHHFSRPWLDQLFWLVTETGGALIMLPVVGTAVWFWWQNQQKVTWLILASFGGTFALNSLLKLLFARPRPNVFPPLMVATSYSFPSGHTMSAVAVYGLLSFLLWQRRRYGWSILVGLWVPLVALSRVYLGVHYPSDVLASLALGTIWLVIVWFTKTGRVDQSGRSQ